MSVKKTIGTVQPTPLGSVVEIVMGVLFIAFGIVFWVSVAKESSSGAGPIGIFFIIWFIVCGGFVGHGVLNLLTCSKTNKVKIPPGVGGVVEFTQFEEDGEEDGKVDFAARLRKLEALKKDRLITGEEYERKRAEIMQDKW